MTEEHSKYDAVTKDAEIKIKIVDNGYILKSGSNWKIFEDAERMLMAIRSELGRQQRAFR